MNARLAYAAARALPRPPIKEARQSLGILTARENHHTPSPAARKPASRVRARALRTRLCTPVPAWAPVEFLLALCGERTEACAARRENECEREDWEGSWFDDPCGLSVVSEVEASGTALTSEVTCVAGRTSHVEFAIRFRGRPRQVHRLVMLESCVHGGSRCRRGGVRQLGST